MNLDECITILTEYNKWWCDETIFDGGVIYPIKLSEAIDYAIEELHRLKGLEK